LEKTERILMKLVLIQFIVLVLVQLFFHHLGVLPELKEITKYEGVNENIKTDSLQTFQDKR